MPEAERLSGLIGQIYDAALDSSLWVSVLEKCAEFVGGVAASLTFKDACSKSGQYVFQSGLDPHYVQLYFDKYIRLDPLTTGQCFASIEQPTATADHIPYDQFINTRLYKEWAQPQGLVDAATAVL